MDRGEVYLRHSLAPAEVRLGQRQAHLRLLIGREGDRHRILRQIASERDRPLQRIGIVRTRCRGTQCQRVVISALCLHDEGHCACLTTVYRQLRLG